MLEILVCLSLITLLLSLVIPAVMVARDSSRRVECANRLRQLGIALHHFEATRQSLPAVPKTAPPKSTMLSLPVHSQLLPYLEQGSLLDAVFDADQARDLVLADRADIAVLQCPSDPAPRGISFRVCTGAKPSVFQADETGDWPGDPDGYGAFPFLRYDESLSFADFSDGMSNTAAMSERVIADVDTASFDAEQDIRFSGFLALDPPKRELYDPDRIASVCRTLTGPPGNQYIGVAGRGIWDASYVSGSYNHVLPPNSSVTDCSPESVPADSTAPQVPNRVTTLVGAVSARSYHIGQSVNVLLMDGSTRAVGPDVSLSVWRALATRQDSDLVSF